MSSQLSSKEVTQAVARYARRHTMFARTIRTITSVKRHAIVEWLESKNDPRLAAWLPSVTCRHPKGCTNKANVSEVLCDQHLTERAALVRKVFNQCDGCRVGDEVRGGTHYNSAGGPYMTCQAERYANS